MSNKTQLQTNNTNLASYTDRVNALISVANSLPEAGQGSGGGSVEYEIVTIPEGATSATYTLPRVTNAYGTITNFLEFDAPFNLRGFIFSINDDLTNYIDNLNGVMFTTETSVVHYNQGTITWDNSFVGSDITLLLINDQNKAPLFNCTPS